jgi:hypothetical protein
LLPHPDQESVASSRVDSVQHLTDINPVHRSLENTLQQIFPESQEESRLQKARVIMGDSICQLTDEELEVYLTMLEYLVVTWLDNYERRIFNGLTLKQIVMEQ